MRSLEQIDADIAQTKAALQNVKGTQTEVYARIVGYYRSVRNWNCGKRDEYNHRKLFEHDTNSVLDTVATSCFSAATESIVTEKPRLTIVHTDNTSNIASFEMFVRKTCPNCPAVKDYLELSNVKGITIDVDSTEGYARAIDLGIFSAPTVVFYDNNQKEISRSHCVAELEQIIPLKHTNKREDFLKESSLCASV
ncbi:MAG: anaerobic ribonucleoside-triphosphate reductase [Treponemataceae bacterium]